MDQLIFPRTPPALDSALSSEARVEFFVGLEPNQRLYFVLGGMDRKAVPMTLNARVQVPRAANVKRSTLSGRHKVHEMRHGRRLDCHGKRLVKI